MEVYVPHRDTLPSFAAGQRVSPIQLDRDKVLPQDRDRVPDLRGSIFSDHPPLRFVFNILQVLGKHAAYDRA